MFDSQTGSQFWSSWARPWDACSFPWFEAEDVHRRAQGALQQTPAARHQGHRKSRSLPEEYFRPAAARPQQATNEPKPHDRKPRTIAPVDPSQSTSRLQVPESSSSHYSTDTETAEPMDFWPEPRPAVHHKHQQQKHRQQQHRHTQAATKSSSAASSASAGTPAKSSAHAYTAATGSGQQQQQQQKKQKQQHAALAVRTRLTPAAAATVIQAAWRMYRLSRHRQSLNQLSSAAAELRRITAQLEATKEAAAAAGAAITQKQYLELSEPVMRVLFQLDSISCGSAVELRSMRKQLSASANKLLDDIQAAHKSSQAAQR